MRWPSLLVAGTIAAILLAGGEAKACMVNAPLSIGETPLNAADVAAKARRDARRQAEREARLTFARRTALARSALAEGKDPAPLLAEMLVPNVRPVMLAQTDCGPADEFDLAPGREGYEDWLQGTAYAGRSGDFWPVLEAHENDMLGRACNAEFRRRFAAYLQARMDPAALAEAFLVLSPYWSGIERDGAPGRRLAAFAYPTRRPPLQTMLYPDQQKAIDRWMRTRPRGQVLQQATADFWREHAPLLASTEEACPAAAARWPQARAEILAEIAREDAERLDRARASEGKQAQQ